LAEAAGEIDAVAELLKEKYGHRNTSVQEIAGLLESADAEHVYAPHHRCAACHAWSHNPLGWPCT